MRMQYPAPEQTHELDISLLTALSSSIGFQYPKDAAYYNLFIDVLTLSRVARQELQLTLVSTDKVVRELIEHYPAMLPPNADIKIEPLADVMSGFIPIWIMKALV